VRERLRDGKYLGAGDRERGGTLVGEGEREMWLAPGNRDIGESDDEGDFEGD
jgi:hypothetical protein